MNTYFFIVLWLGILSLTIPTFAQNTGITSHEALQTEIQARAKKDAQLDKPHKTLHELHLRFGDKAKTLGIGIDQVEEWYDDAYEKAKPWWKSQQMAWLVAIISLLSLLALTLNKFLTDFLVWLKDKFYRQFSGYRFLHPIALRRYRRALIGKYQQIKIPFRPQRPLEMREIFVPLKVKGTHDIEQIDAYQAITQYKRLMVVGAPGAGKTMLLRYVALSYAEARLSGLPKQPVPILLELNRLNESDEPIEQKLVEILRLNDFPNAKNFVEIGLRQGTLILLFDGLDEVNTKERQRVVKQINDFLDTYKQCRAILTCRTAVYRNEFAEKTEQTLEIVEFSDQQIQQFLVPWQKDMPPEKSIEQLLFALRDKPRIMALARNPLLLTIIAYLYSDTQFILPHSRTEFYSTATDVLLNQWKVERNCYKAAEKRLVLQHLALFNQDSGAKRKQDRRSIDLKTVLAQVKTVLPDLNLAEENVQPLLDEIVERSGLLLSIDGGERYQFAHLTLQEFFAAAALRDDSEKLLKRFQDDPDSWRETVKLWCGLDHDSTDLIQAIYTADSVMAFECLADAQKVNADLADEIITAFKPQLGTDGKQGEAINQAFAAVAADIRPRGQTVLDFLADTLAHAEESERRIAAANTLSLTNVPKAAELLASCYANRIEQVRPALVRLGNLAVPKLEVLAQQGHLNALDDLQAIGTIQAATKLVPFLWHEENLLASRAALNLASLLPQSEIENALREYSLTDKQQKADWFEWIWEPFNKYEPKQSFLSVIVGRMAYLINQVSEKEILNFEKVSNLEPRIVIPLVVQYLDKWKKIIEKIIEKVSEPKRVFSKLKTIWEDEAKPLPTISDWKQIFIPSKYEFEKSWHFNVILFIFIIISIINLYSLLFFSFKFWNFFTNIELTGKDGILLIISPFLVIFFFLINISVIIIFIVNLLLPYDLLKNLIRKERDEVRITRYFLYKKEIYELGITKYLLYLVNIFLVMLLMKDLSFPWWTITGIWLIFALVITLLILIGLRKDREAKNPLHGILEPPETSNTSTLKQRGLVGWLRWLIR